MANRYQDRRFPADYEDQGTDPHGRESDPLAELARLIGQTDPFGTTSRASQKVQPRSAPVPDPYPQEPEYDEAPPPAPPSWMQRANRQEIQPEARQPVYEEPEPEPEPDYQPSAVHPLHRYAQHPAPQEAYDEQPYEGEGEVEVDPSRYDDALYGQLEGEHDYQRDAAYPDDPYAYQQGYAEEGEDGGEKRRGGLLKVAAVLVLAVVGTGAAFAYRSYVSVPRSGDPPIIRADNSPTKVMPSPADGTPKVPDRMAVGDSAEKIVSREETPVDVNARAASGGPRVVFPPLNQNSNPPSPASVAPATIPAASAGPVPTNGTLPNNEPRKVRTLTVRGDQADGGQAAAPAVPGAAPAAKSPAAAAKAAAAKSSPSSANASANAPMSLTPEASPQAPAPDPRTRVAATNPTQAAPAPAASAGGNFMVQVSSQRSESDAQASFRALQGKFPGVLGSQTPVIRRADLGDKGTYYRAMVGPFGSAEEASQFCGNLKSAGGQCVVQRN
ncbi:SPOR domain-containing protein [Bradyrhizobium sp. NP1]|uniref:SPOR domain-containing protein n=1 Tax=Bradyrhizobium sp. NP1 TaxID=3049772 RepID=UPI0025A57033|nr:SPOR domain-containing protein [Bradyrhizobium sp. NP1]WJR81588.1 SPOR domain-containing protein [Bradyrhizobium sp. NP1]